jgi:hypothetical protein
MSESQLRKRHPVVEKIGYGVGGLLLASLAYGAGASAHDHIFSSDKVNAKEVERAAIKAAQAEEVAHENAVSMAADYTQQFAARKGGYIPMQVLNGEIRMVLNKTSGTKGGARPVYKNPILLSTVDPNAKPDKNGDFLNGGWIGIQGNDKDGNVVITAVPFTPIDGEVQEFVAYNPSQVVYDTIGVYATAVKGGPGLDIYGLIGFDPTGNRQLQNPDGSVIRPGLSMGMK